VEYITDIKKFEGLFAQNFSYGVGKIHSNETSKDHLEDQTVYKINFFLSVDFGDLNLLYAFITKTCQKCFVIHHFPWKITFVLL